jgi:hypothetical protein
VAGALRALNAGTPSAGAADAGVAGPVVTDVAVGGAAGAAAAEVVAAVAGALDFPSGLEARPLAACLPVPALAVPPLMLALPPLALLGVPLPLPLPAPFPGFPPVAFPGLPPPVAFAGRPPIRLAGPALTALAVLASEAPGPCVAGSLFAIAATGTPTATARQARQALSNRRFDGPTSEERGPQTRM